MVTATRGRSPVPGVDTWHPVLVPAEGVAAPTTPDKAWPWRARVGHCWTPGLLGSSELCSAKKVVDGSCLSAASLSRLVQTGNCA